MDDWALARWRLHTLRLTGQTYPSATAALDGLLAVQAEKFAHATWSVATRTATPDHDDLHQKFDDGELLRTHVLRSTWHFVRPDDIRWLVELTAPRLRPVIIQLARSLDLTQDVLDRAAEVITAALAGGVHLTRDQLRERLDEAGIDASGQRLGVALLHAELAALICSGAMQGGAQTYALLQQRAPHARRLSRDEALAEIVRRYFSGHGPATERDLSYWATLTLTDVRRGLDAVAGELDHIDHDGRTYWFTDPRPRHRRLAPRGHLLLILDEYHNGYQDSRYVLDAGGLIPRGRPRAMGMALVDGQMVGDMRRTVRGDTVTFEVTPFRRLDPDETQALEEATERCRAFLGVESAEVVVRATATR